MRRGPALGSLLCLSVLLGPAGCEITPKRPDSRVSVDAPVPSYSAVAERYNRRVARLDKVWARISMRVSGIDKEGNKIDEQAEGHLQVIRPDKLALSITKLGETYFYLGSNERQYWWIDLHEDKRALVGRHEKATPQLAARFDVPVHPLDLLELLGITPLPPGSAATTAWTRDGRWLEVTLPGRWGRRRLLLDPAGYQPARIELLDTRGKLLVAAELQAPQPVVVRCDSATPPMASLYEIDLVSTGAHITLRLYEPENRCDRQKLTPFDLDALLKAYGVTTIESLDEIPAQPVKRPVK